MGIARRSFTATLMILFAAAAALAGVTSRPVQAAKPLQLVALGDSLTAGYLLPNGQSFADVLQRRLREKGRDVTVSNAGVSGDTATGGLERLDWSVPQGTDGVIVELGANDMLRGVDTQITRKALETIVTRLKERGIPVLLAGMRASRNLGPDYVTRFDAIYADLAERYGLVLYPFFLDGIVGDKAYNLPDGLHPNRQGVEKIVEGILPSVETFLGRLEPVAN